MKGQLHIDQIFAFIVRDKDGTEGVCGWLNPATGLWVPLIGADLARVEAVRPIAADLAKALKTPITLAFFSTRHNIEVLKP
jgi:hypothetical protein